MLASARGGIRGGSAQLRARRSYEAGALLSDVVVPGPGPAAFGASQARAEGSSSTRAGRRATRRRPSGAPPALPHPLRTTGAGWLIGAVVAIVYTVLIYRNGVQGVAIDAIAADDAIVRWVSDIDLPGLDGTARVVSYASSWWAIEIV